MQRHLTGVVTRDQNKKTRRVEVARLYRHPKYGKIVRARTICYVHDEQEVSRKGDTVEIVECRPRSRTKRWELVKVIQTGNRAPAVSETSAAAGV